ncbi:hypothetical protein KR009_003857 [Drosophila setifemur]|nr:hypothetical protein KR009_003857 [Drosophila setifemur]
MSVPPASKRLPEPKSPTIPTVPRITVTRNPNGGGNLVPGKAVPKSPDGLSSLVARKSITSMSEDEIIQENLNEILDLKSREERKANGRLVAVIVCFLVLFLAVYHACVRKSENSLAGVLVPAGIMLSYGAWVVVLAKRDKHRRAMFERHIEEVAMKNKTELEEKHARHHAKHSGHSGSVHSGSVHSGSVHSGTESTEQLSTLQYVNELLPNGEHRKKQRRHRHKERSPGEKEHPDQRLRHQTTPEIGVHRGGGSKRPSIRQKLFGQTISHVKLVEAQSDSTDSSPGTGPSSKSKSKSGSGSSSSSNSNPGERRLQKMNTLPMAQVVRVGSVP